MRALRFVWITCLGALASAAPARAAKIACVGDSITYGYNLADPNTQSYPAVLQGLVGKSHTVRNFGVSGTTLLKNGDSPYWDDPNFSASGDFAPDVVVIMLGTNDSKSLNWSHQCEFLPDYQALVAHYRGLGAFVYVAAPPPVYDPGAYDIQPSVLNDDIVPLVRQIASDVNAPLVDVYQALSGKPEDFPDTVHPNADGAKIIAETIDAALSTYGFGGNGAAGASGAAGANQGGRAGAEGGQSNAAGANSGGTTSAGAGGVSNTSGAGGSMATSGGRTGVGGAAGASFGAGGTAVGGASAAAGVSGRNANSAGNQGAAGRGGGATSTAGGSSGGASATAGSAHGGNSGAHAAGSNDGGCGCRLHHPAGMRDRSAFFACSALLAIAWRRRRVHARPRRVSTP
jgi:lysophospholipase L1-like esterase